MSALPLEAWFHGAATDVSPTGVPVGEMLLYRVSADAEPWLLDTMTLPEEVEERTEEWCAERCSYIRRICQQEADAESQSGRSGTSKFAIMFKRVGASEPEGGYPFVVVGERVNRTIEEALGGRSEPANEMGDRSMIQRHSEDLMSMVKVSWEATVGNLRWALDRETKLRIAAEERANEGEMMRQAMLDRAQDRAIEAAKIAARERRLDEVFQTLKPVAAHLLAGVPGAGPAVLGQEILAVASELTDEDKAAIVQNLPPETKAKLVRVLATADKALETAKAAAAKAAAAPPLKKVKG